ncbi:hypothetical protein OE766_05455 [Pararhizobium sp. YC-54]|uniref:hypothetical protein n=1 Tax=Pararhizobium sp. YC-54 TaxID=2986920 RepID=UPI0021F7869E|nr:hypothetical protein [Pararhizobium sp. YC-54]MCV9997686.1 hypothetical protein [Pararhizobium sp. YC-54]
MSYPWEVIELKDAFLFRGPAAGRPKVITAEAVETSVIDDTGPNTGALRISTTLSAGGQGSTFLAMEIPSTEFAAIAQLMFAANRDRAIKAFAKALSKTSRIPPVLPS